jgi:hypothetical protein
MAHLEQKEFCEKIKAKYPSYFKNKIVLDVGSLDINGNNRYLFDDCVVTGIDVGPGNNVDYVCVAHEFKPLLNYNFVISTECFEHDMHYDKTIKHIIDLLPIDGAFLFTCATVGRPEHGTRRTSPEDAPLLSDEACWSDYYKNLTEEDIKKVFDPNLFKEHLFEVNNNSHDLYFFGIK